MDEQEQVNKNYFATNAQLAIAADAQAQATVRMAEATERQAVAFEDIARTTKELAQFIRESLAELVQMARDS